MRFRACMDDQLPLQSLAADLPAGDGSWVRSYFLAEQFIRHDSPQVIEPRTDVVPTGFTRLFWWPRTVCFERQKVRWDVDGNIHGRAPTIIGWFYDRMASYPKMIWPDLPQDRLNIRCAGIQVHIVNQNPMFLSSYHRLVLPLLALRALRHPASAVAAAISAQSRRGFPVEVAEKSEIRNQNPESNPKSEWQRPHGGFRGRLYPAPSPARLTQPLASRLAWRPRAFKRSSTRKRSRKFSCFP